MTEQTAAYQPHPHIGGRQTALSALARWRAGGDPGTATVLLTGSPGSGRSRLLTGFLMLCDPEFRKLVDTDALDPATVPPADLPAPLVFGAAGLTPTQLLWLIADELGLGVGRTEDVYALLAEPQDRPVPVVVADVDRAGVLRGPDGPARAAEDVLLPLALAPGIRLVAEVDREQAEWLAGRVPAEDLLVIDLDEEPWADPGALLLQAATLVADPAEAEAIAARAGGPLVVELAAWSLQAVPDGPAVGHPVTVGDALDLHAERCGVDELTLRRLLAPLALADTDSGLPFELWGPLASAVAGRDLSAAFAQGQRLLLPFFDQVHDDEAGAAPRVRLRHPALAEELRSRFGSAVREAGRRLADALTAGLPAGADRWAAASEYTRTGLIGPALEGGVLPELMAEPGFLVHVDQVVLRAAAEHLVAEGAELPPLGRTWLRLAPLFTRTQADPRTIAGLLEHACHREGAPVPDFGIALPWRTLWHRPPAGAVAAATAVDGSSVAVVRRPEGEQAWEACDARTGELSADPAAQFLGLSAEQRESCPVRLSVGADHVRIWAADGRLLAVFVAPEPLIGADVTPDGIVLLADATGVSALELPTAVG